MTVSFAVVTEPSLIVNWLVAMETGCLLNGCHGNCHGRFFCDASLVPQMIFHIVSKPPEVETDHVVVVKYQPSPKVKFSFVTSYVPQTFCILALSTACCWPWCLLMVVAPPSGPICQKNIQLWLCPHLLL